MIQKPPRGTLINPAHPWVGPAGMQGFYALNEGTGGIASDSLQNLNLAATGFGATNPWGVGSQGGIFASVTGASVRAALPNWSTLSLPITLICGFRPIVTSGSAPQFMLFGITQNNTFSSPFYAASLSTNVGEIVASWNSAGTAHQIAAMSGLVAGTDYVVSATFSSSGQSLYVNGNLAASASTYNSNPTFTSTSYSCFGSIPGLSVNPQCLYYYGVMLNKAIPASVHAAIGANVNAIWQIFQPARSLFTASGGGIASLTEEQIVSFYMRRRRRVKDSPVVPGFRARNQLW